MDADRDNMPINELRYRAARPDDYDAIVTLLDQYDLPASDCGEHLDNFIVVEHDDSIVAVGGYEEAGDFGLIRSFAVDERFTGQRIAETIFTRLTSKATQSGKTHFYLLTTTASQYFTRLGFMVCDRDTVPDVIRATKQFNDLCPASATVMMRPLDENNR